MKNLSVTDKDVLIEEYKIIAEMHKHFDNMNLSMMSTVIAGVFVLWSVLLNSITSRPFSWALVVMINWIVLLILSGWIRYMSIHRGIVVRKLTRAHEIESILNMQQHLMFRDDDPIKRRRNRPGAHSVELWIYLFLVALGSVVSFALSVSTISQRGIQAMLLILLYLISNILPLVTAMYWAILCRVDVAQIIPFYRLPDNRFMRWLLVNIGHYEDLHREIEIPNKEI